MEGTNSVLVLASVLSLAATGFGALSFDDPGEANFIPSVLGDLNFMTIHQS